MYPDFTQQQQQNQFLQQILAGNTQTKQALINKY